MAGDSDSRQESAIEIAAREKVSAIVDILSTEWQTAVTSLYGSLRAEKASGSYVERYADNAKYNTLNVPANQILKGRRGTGKTHLLKMLEEEREQSFAKDRQLAVFIDLRQVKATSIEGSSPGEDAAEHFRRFLVLFSDQAQSKLRHHHPFWWLPWTGPARAIRVLRAVRDYAEKGRDWPKLGREETVKRTVRSSSTAELSQSASVGSSEEETIESTRAVLRTLQFGEIGKKMRELMRYARLKMLFLLIDEWAEIDLPVQPLFAECLKNAFFSLPECSVKIGVIPHRTQMSMEITGGNPIGLEVTGDIYNVDLDDNLIYDRDRVAASRFFRELLFKHLKPYLGDTLKEFLTGDSSVSERFTSQLFTQNGNFVQLMRASGGIPRDFLHIFVSAYNKHLARRDRNRIGANDVKEGARDWFRNDKIAEIRANNTLEYQLLQGITDYVAKFPKKRIYFLLHPDLADYYYIKKLIDLRLLHRVKESSSTGEKSKGIRYMIMALDYGCFADVLETRAEIDFDLEDFESELGDDPLDPDMRSLRKRVLPERIIEEHKALVDSTRLRAMPRTEGSSSELGNP